MTFAVFGLLIGTRVQNEPICESAGQPYVAARVESRRHGQILDLALGL